MSSDMLYDHSDGVIHLFDYLYTPQQHGFVQLLISAVERRQLSR